MDRQLRSNARDGSLPSSTSEQPKKKMRKSTKGKDDSEDVASDAQPEVQDKQSSQQMEKSTEEMEAPTESSAGKKANRKKHEALEYAGYVWHHNKTVTNAKGQTSYYDCSE